MSSMTRKQLIASSVLFLTISFSGFAMNEQELKDKKLTEKRELLEGYRNLITDKRNEKKYHPYYLYEEGALKLISLILEVDKDDDILSDKSVEVLRLLSTTCCPKFDRSKKVGTQLRISGINTILYIDNSILNEQKKRQIFHALISDVTCIEKTEYMFWLFQAIQEKNGSMIRYLIDEPFSYLLNENFYHEIFKIITNNYGDINFSRLQKIQCLHFFHKTVEEYFSENYDIYTKVVISNDEEGKKDKARFNFFVQQVERFMDYLHSKSGYACLGLAIDQYYWDYIDYCFDRISNKIGITVESDILNHILKLDKKKLADEAKFILIRHFIFHAQQQRTLKKIVSSCEGKIFIELARRKCNSLLRYAIYSGLDLNDFTEGKNFITTVLNGWDRVDFNLCTQQMKTILHCLDEKDKKNLLNPRKGIIPLTLFLKKNGLEMFKFFVKEGANPWHYNKHLILPLNTCSTVLMMNIAEKKEGYLDLHSRLSYVKYMVTHAKNNNKIDELLNNKNIVSPLLCAITDLEDKNGVTGEYLIAHGARFTSSMFKYLLNNELYSNKEKELGIQKVLKMVKHNELAPLFDHTMNRYSKDEIWRVVQAIEQSKRTDKKACLYALFKNISFEVYQEIRKKVQNQELKNIKNISWGIMGKIEKSICENQYKYEILNTSNPRYQKEKSMSIYARDKYLNLM